MTEIPLTFQAPDDGPRPHPDDAPEPPPATGYSTTDPDAPWGRRADGTPRAKPGRPAGTPNTGPRRPAPPRASVPPPRPAAPRKPKAKQVAGPDYRAGINGLFQLVAAPLAMAGIKNDSAAADAAALTVYGPGIADALHDLAVERPEVAALLERILSAGPYGALIAAVLPLVVQLLTNHGVLPGHVGTAMGAQDPAALVGMLRPDPARAA